ncbi:MAG: pyridoxamine 5'-phosphate oxidase family protein [Chloroflexi bacterium]|nr:pyridoxamine 5'-phosphate oxidase family protein [Chloroflexota bacterium]MQC16686.1 pyridoxamine 5'-phosphate oxidase family protein [Chloroflexota bacterium]
MAVSLSEEMQEAINNAFTDGFPIVWATAGADQRPVIGFFGTTQAFSDHEIGVWMRTPERGFLGRIAENPKASLLYRNTTTRISFQIHMECRRVDDEEIRKQIWTNSAEREREQDPEMLGVAVIAEIVRVVQRGEVIMQRD